MVKGIKYREKQYVEVDATHDISGSVQPLQIYWNDGRVFPVKGVLNTKKAESLKVGGKGVRFLIKIGHKETFLFYENPRWFVEKIIPEDSSVRSYGNAYKNEIESF